MRRPLRSAAARLVSGAQGGSAQAAPRPLPRPPCTPLRQGRAPWVRLPAVYVGGLYESRGGCSRSVGGLFAPSAALRHYARQHLRPRGLPPALLAASLSHPHDSPGRSGQGGPTSSQERAVSRSLRAWLPLRSALPALRRRCRLRGSFRPLDSGPARRLRRTRACHGGATRPLRSSVGPPDLLHL